MSKFQFMTLRTLGIIAAITTSVCTFLACNKDNSNGKTDLKIKLTGNPYDATEVNVDIQQVRVNVDDGWTDLVTHAGVYNLLDFQNGVDTLVAFNPVRTGTLKEIRFVLGSNNSIMINNILYPLTIPSGSESGLKIKLNKALHADIDSCTVDFDAALSIHQTGTGEYNLQPVLKVR